MSMTQDCLIDHPQGSDEFPSLIFRQDRHSSLPVQDGLVPGNHDDQLGSGAASSLGGLQESDVPNVEKVECSSGKDGFWASQPCRFPTLEESVMDERMILRFVFPSL